MNLRREVSKALLARGFERDGRSHLLRLSDGFSFYVDTGPLGRRSDIAPEVGIRHDEVERLSAELTELEHDTWVGTIGANVGCVNGDGYQRWEDIAQKDDVLRAIDRAMQRLKPFLSLDRLADAWDACGVRDRAIRPYREIPIMLLRGADSGSILRKLDEARAYLCVQEDEVTEQFRTFEAGVHRHLAARANK